MFYDPENYTTVERPPSPRHEEPNDIDMHYQQQQQSLNINTRHVIHQHQHHTPQTILVTGGAGFIGSHTAVALLSRGDRVVIVDEMNTYYDVSVKWDNLSWVKTMAKLSNASVEFIQGTICDRALMERVVVEYGVDGIIHLAARAGVRHSIANPDVYVETNVLGTTVLLDVSAKYRTQVKHMVYASSSSVYGRNTKVPFSERDVVERPASPYAATKKACETMAAAYADIYRMPVTGLRFFTVYGPRGRPDMAPYKFVDKIMRGEEIEQYGDGTSSRDYTYIDDIVAGIVAAYDRPFLRHRRRVNRATMTHLPSPMDDATDTNDANDDDDGRLHRIYNLGNSSPVTLHQFIATVEMAVGQKARKRLLPDQPGDVECTYADISLAAKELNYHPRVPLDVGMQRLVQWYKQNKH